MLSRASRVVWCLCGALAAGGSVGAAAASSIAGGTGAGGTDETRARARGAVVIAVPAGDEILREGTLRPALDSHFADTQFEPELRRLPAGDILAHLAWAEGQPAGGRAHAVLWVETGRDGGQQLYLLQPSSGRVWVRALPMASEPEVAAESLGVMVRALALGLEGGEPVGMQEVVIERPVAAGESEGERSEPTPAPVRTRPEVLVAAGYHGSSVAADRRWHSGVELRLGLRMPVGMLLSAGAAWSPPVDGQGEPRLDLERVAIDLRGGWQWRPHARVHPQLDASVIAEALRWDLQSTPQLMGRRGTAWRIGVAPGAGLTVRLWRGLGLRIHGQADVWLRNAELVLQDGADRSTLTRMHPVAGRLDVGLAAWL